MKSPSLIFATSDNEDNNVEPVGTDEQQEQGTIDNSDETDDSDRYLMTVAVLHQNKIMHVQL